MADDLVPNADDTFHEATQQANSWQSFFGFRNLRYKNACTRLSTAEVRQAGICWTECEYKLTVTEHWGYVLFRYYETWETDVDYKAILDAITGLPGTIVGVGLGAIPATSATAVTGVSLAGTAGAIGFGAVGAGITLGAYIDKALFPAERKTGEGWIPDGFGPYDTGMKMKNTWSFGKSNEMVDVWAYKQYRPPRRKWEDKVRSRYNIWLDCSPRIPCPSSEESPKSGG